MAGDFFVSGISKKKLLSWLHRASTEIKNFVAVYICLYLKGEIDG